MFTSLPTINAFDTTWWIEIFAELPPETKQAIFNDLRGFISNFENNYSRFKPESILSDLNTTHHINNPSPEMVELLTLGLKLYRDTNEVFNILLGEQLANNNYDSLYSFIPKNNHIATPDLTEVMHISNQKITLTIGHIDVGGYAKGFLIDKIATRLSEHYGLKHFLINGGGNMYASSDDGRPVTIHLEHPGDSETIISKTTLLNEGFAASDTTKRCFEKDGQIHSHIINNRGNTCRIADHGVFVKAPTAALADAWVTTLVLSRPEDHLEKMTEAGVRAAIYQSMSDTIKYYGEF